MYRQRNRPQDNLATFRPSPLKPLAPTRVYFVAMDAFFDIASPVPEPTTAEGTDHVLADYDHGNGNASGSCVVA